jgi:outer membrane protein assembly factor BamD (BamD/ComL family)
VQKSFGLPALGLLLLGAALARAQAADPLGAACDQAAAQLAAGKAGEALAALEPLLKDAAHAKSPHRERAYYYVGCAAFALENDLAAGRALSRLAPFQQPAFGAHARYLLGRLHHRAGEYTEALAHYEAVAASKSKAELVAESNFHAGVVLYEQKSFPEALAKFVAFLQQDKRPEWVAEAQLRAGMCQVRVGQNPEALKTLQPLQDHAKLARAVRWWMAKAILAIPGSKVADAAEHLKKAAGAPDVETGPATAVVLLALGDALERAGKPAEAVEVYKQLATAGASAEEALARLSGAYAAAKQYKEADDAAVRFEKQHPASPLLGDVLLRRADISFAEAQGKGDPALFAEALKRYERVLGGASGAAAHAARYRMAVAHARLNKFSEAVASLRAIPDEARVGELAAASLLHGECLLRMLPPAEEAGDAIVAAQLLKDLQEAAAQLGKGIGNAGDKVPEVTMKLGHALRQIASLLVDPAERAQAANQARELYENFRAQHPNHPLRPVAEYERANCYALAGDVNSAIQKLERFKQAPFADAAVAPLALLRQGQLYRQANNPAQAAAILGDCRTKYEAALLKDAARAAWVPLLRYHHAAALKAANQGAQAAPILESIVKDFGGSEWAEPSRRLLKEGKP